MRKYLAIIACKLGRFVGKLVKRGSSLPGKLALKIDPNILSKIRLPQYVIAVTGSNGKTSTVEMMYQVLTKAGYSVACNKEGSNQIEGVTTFILENVTLSGRFTKDIVLIESDERYARHTFRHFVPTHYVITNLYRDQLTRNGHPEWIYDIIKDSIHDGSKLILNADDPLISRFGVGHNNDVYYFGIERFSGSEEECSSVYDDGKYCPVCHRPMVYEYRHFNHIGKYRCEHCGYERHDPDYRITDIDLNEGYLMIEDRYRIDLSLKSIYNAYNILSVYAVADLLKISGETVAECLNNYILKNGRVQYFKAGSAEGMLLTSKHENSISYNQSLRVIENHDGDVTVMVMVDAISRKYFTSETSWLWDIDFERLNSENVRRIIVTGLYSSDVAERLVYADVDMNKVVIEKDIPAAIEYLKENSIGYTYMITCFSDQDKFLSRVEVQK